MATSSTTFQPKWQTGPTKLIRVPEALTEEILAYARFLDARAAGDTGVAEPGAAYTTAQKPLDLCKPVNVASVPLRSPFRYPGGKTWLVPYLRQWLLSLSSSPSLFIEPFAGGGIASLTVAFESLATHVILAELDENVASVWKTMLHGHAEWLAKRILNFELSEGNVRAELNHASDNEVTLRERAFRAILRNRVQRGGIMAPGAGLIKSGENGRGLGSRWYPDTLARRIREIGMVRSHLTFAEGDGMELIRTYGNEADCVFFADPPYTKAAQRLYAHWQFDHRALFEAFAGCKANFLISYDNTEEIVDLAKEFGFSYRPIRMKNTHNSEMTELLIGRSFDWLEPHLV